jgi:hypothetical protein
MVICHDETMEDDARTKARQQFLFEYFTRKKEFYCTAEGAKWWFDVLVRVAECLHVDPRYDPRDDPFFFLPPPPPLLRGGDK